MAERTKEKNVEEKRSRYSGVSIILRQMFGVRLTGMPGYILLQDVVYKHLKKPAMSLDRLIEWACKHFVFDITPEEAKNEILEVITNRLPESDDGDNFQKIIEAVLAEATDLYEKQVLYAKVSEAVRKLYLSPLLEQNIIKIVFELKRGKTIEEALRKLATEDLSGVPAESQKGAIEKKIESYRNTIMIAFHSESELSEFAGKIG